MKLKVSDFKGVYTNADGNDLALEYLKDAVDCKFREGYVESEGFQLSTVTLPQLTRNDLEFDEKDYARTLYLGYVELDDDRLANAYIPNIKKYPFYVYVHKENRQDSNVHLLFAIKDTDLYTQKIVISTGYKETIKVIRLVYSNGRTKVITNYGVYEVCRINRTLKSDYQTLSEKGYNNFYVIPKDLEFFDISPEIITESNVVSNYQEVEYNYYNAYPVQNGIGGVVYKCSNRNNGVTIKYPLEGEFWDGLVSELPAGSHIFFTGSGVYYIPIQYFDFFDFRDTYIIKQTGQSFKSLLGQETTIYYGSSYQIKCYTVSKRLFSLIVDKRTEDFVLYKSETVEEVGLEYPEKKNVELIITTVFDNKEEYVANYVKRQIADSDMGSKTKYMIKFNYPNFPERINTTRICLYARFKKQDEFEQFAVIDYLDPLEVAKTTVYLTDRTLNGVYLSQTIGMKYDSATYKPIFNYTDFLYVGKVPYVLYGSNVYSPAVGNGQVMEIFYSQNFIPDVTNRKIIKLTNVNNDLGVHTDKDLVVINQQNDEQGGILFFVRNVLGLPIVNEYQVSEAPDGIVALTKFGIYVTNGTQREMISKSINDLIEKYYTSGIIAYNAMEEELYLVINSQLWVFSFITQTWSRKSLNVRNTVKIEVDYDKVYFYFANGSKLLSRVYNIYSKLESHSTDLNEPNLLKRLDGSRWDYIGGIKRKGKIYLANGRSLLIFKENIKDRRPKAKIEYSIEFSGKLYGVEMDVEPVTEVRKKVFVAIPDPGIITPLPPIKEPTIGVSSE